MQITQNEDQSGQTNIAWLVRRYANSLKQLRGHYEGLLRHSHTWRSWAAGRISGLRSINVAWLNGFYEGSIARAGIHVPIIYRWIGASDPYFGNPFPRPRLSSLWYPPLWRWWLQMPSFVEAGPEEAANLGYYTAGEHLTAPVPLAELTSVDALPQPPKEALVERRGSRSPLTTLPLKLSLANVLMSHPSIPGPSPFSFESSSYPLNPFYPETELVHLPISTLLRAAAHPPLPDSSGEGGISPYSYWERTPALAQHMPLPPHVMALSTTSGEPLLALQRLPLLSTVLPAILASEVAVRHFEAPVLSKAALPLNTGVYPEPRIASWPSLSMPLAPLPHSDLTWAHGLDIENYMVEGVAPDAGHGHAGETIMPIPWDTLRRIGASLQTLPSTMAESPQMEAPLPSSSPALKLDLAHLTIATSFSRELMRRHQGILLTPKGEFLADEGPPSMVTMSPSVLQTFAISEPHEPYLTRGISELLPTLAASRGEDALTPAIPQAKSAAYAESRYPEEIPLAHKALPSLRQWAHVRRGDDNLYVTLAHKARMTSLRGDLEGAQTPSYEEISPSTYGLEQIRLPLTDAEASTMVSLEGVLAQSYGGIGPGAENATRSLSWPAGAKGRGQSSPSSAVPQPQAATPGYDGWSAHAGAASVSPSQGSGSPPTVARAPIDRPANGGQTGETDQSAPLDELAEEVYGILKRRLALERERSWGIG